MYLMREYNRDEKGRLTFLQRSSLVLLQPFDCNGFKAHPGSRIFLEYVPHVLLAEDEEVRVADWAHAGCSPVTCVDVAIYWLSGCIKLSYVTHRDRFVDRSAVLPTVDPLSFPQPGCTWFRLHARYVRARVRTISLRSFYIVLYSYKSTVISINRVRYGSVFYVNWLPGRSTRFPDFFRKTFNLPMFVGW